MADTPPIAAMAPVAPGSGEPARSRPVYRAALADRRAIWLVSMIALWIVFHVVMGIVQGYRAQEGFPLSIDSSQASVAWFDWLNLQVGFTIFSRLGSTILDSAVWQVVGLTFLIAGLIVLLTARFRIVALTVPPVFLGLASVLMCVSFSVNGPYWAQGNAILTALMTVGAWVVTWMYAPRNSGMRELRRVVKEWLRELASNPVTMLFGPIFAKEVRVMGRRRSTYWIRGLLPAGLLALVAIGYYGATADINSIGSAANRLQQLQELAPDLALYVNWAEYLFLMFMAATITSSAICDERRTRTLSALMTTPMTSVQIVMGKLAGKLIQLLILALVGVPFLLAVRVFGGLAAESVIAMSSVTLTSAIMMASLGILASVWSKRATAAVALAVLMFLLVSFVPLVITIVISIGARGGPPDEIFAFSSPVTMIALSAIVSGSGPSIGFSDLWITNSIVNLCLAVAFVFFATVSLRNMMLSERALEAPSTSKRKKKTKRATTEPAPAAVEGQTTAEASESKAEVIVSRRSEVWDWPVLWRELRQPALGSRRTTIFVAVAVAGFMVWLYTRVSPREEAVHAVIMVICLVIMVLQAAVAPTPLIANEKEGSTWLTLLTTPMTAREILLSKLLGGLKKLWFLAAILFADQALGVLVGRIHPILIVHLAMIIVGMSVFLGGTGMLFSLWTRKGATAAMLNMLLAALLWLGLPLLGVLLEEFVLRHVFGRSRDLFDVLMVINPIAMAVGTAEPSMVDRSGWQVRSPSGMSLGMFEFTVILAVVSSVGVGIGLAALSIAGTLFARLSGRTS